MDEFSMDGGVYFSGKETEPYWHATSKERVPSPLSAPNFSSPESPSEFYLVPGNHGGSYSGHIGSLVSEGWGLGIEAAEYQPQDDTFLPKERMGAPALPGAANAGQDWFKANYAQEYPQSLGGGAEASDDFSAYVNWDGRVTHGQLTPIAADAAGRAAEVDVVFRQPEESSGPTDTARHVEGQGEERVYITAANSDAQAGKAFPTLLSANTSPIVTAADTQLQDARRHNNDRGLCANLYCNRALDAPHGRGQARYVPQVNALYCNACGQCYARHGRDRDPKLCGKATRRSRVYMMEVHASESRAGFVRWDADGQGSAQGASGPVRRRSAPYPTTAAHPYYGM